MELYEKEQQKIKISPEEKTQLNELNDTKIKLEKKLEED